MSIVRSDSSTPGTKLPNGEEVGIYATQQVIKIHQSRSQKPNNNLHSKLSSTSSPTTTTTTTFTLK